MASIQPAYISKGTLSVVTTLTAAPGLPASILNKDVVLVAAIHHQPNGVGVINTPAGFTELAQVTYKNSSGIDQGRAALFGRRMAGGETGSVSITATGDSGTDTCFAAQTHLIRGCHEVLTPQVGVNANYSLAGEPTIIWPAIQTPIGDLYRHLILAFYFAPDNITVAAPVYTAASGVEHPYTSHASDTTATGTDAALQVFGDADDSKAQGDTVFVSGGLALGWAAFHLMLRGKTTSVYTRIAGTDQPKMCSCQMVATMDEYLAGKITVAQASDFLLLSLEERAQLGEIAGRMPSPISRDELIDVLNIAEAWDEPGCPYPTEAAIKARLGTTL